MHFSDNADEITEWLSQTRDLRKMKEEREDLPLQYFYDMRDSIARVCDLKALTWKRKSCST